MEQEITLCDVANYLDNIGIQFLATIGLDGKPKVRPMQYMVLEDEKLWFCTNSKKEVYAELQANHCRATAEKAILSVAGVTAASVDLATKFAVVEGTAQTEAICKAVEEVGFTCSKA